MGAFDGMERALRFIGTTRSLSFSSERRAAHGKWPDWPWRAFEHLMSPHKTDVANGKSNGASVFITCVERWGLFGHGHCGMRRMVQLVASGVRCFPCSSLKRVMLSASAMLHGDLGRMRGRSTLHAELPTLKAKVTRTSLHARSAGLIT